MDSVLLIVALGAVAAGFVQGLSGFGFGMVAMSFWAWTLEPRLAALLAVCGALTGQLVAAATVRRGFVRVRLLPFVLGGLVGIPIGVAVLPRLDMDAFKVILGTLLVLWCPAMLMAKNLPRITRGGRVADQGEAELRGTVGRRLEAQPQRRQVELVGHRRLVGVEGRLPGIVERQREELHPAVLAGVVEDQPARIARLDLT